MDRDMLLSPLEGHGGATAFDLMANGSTAIQGICP